MVLPRLCKDHRPLRRPPYTLAWAGLSSKAIKGLGFGFEGLLGTIPKFKLES